MPSGPPIDPTKSAFKVLYDYGISRCDAAQSRFRAIDAKASQLMTSVAICMAALGALSYGTLKIDSLPPWGLGIVLGMLALCSAATLRMAYSISSIARIRDLKAPASLSKIKSQKTKLAADIDMYFSTMIDELADVEAAITTQNVEKAECVAKGTFWFRVTITLLVLQFLIGGGVLFYTKCIIPPKTDGGNSGPPPDANRAVVPGIEAPQHTLPPDS